MENHSVIKIAHRIIDDEINSKKKLSELLKKLQTYEFGGIEFDIRQTHDEQFLVFHDAHIPLLRQTISNYSLRELLEEARGKNVSLLTLQEVLEIIPSSFFIQIDIKDKKINVEGLVNILKQHTSPNQIILSSFYPNIILQLSRYDNINQRWLLTNLDIRRNVIHIFYALMPIKFALKCRATGIAPQQNLISKKLLLKAHNLGLTVATWTIDNFETMKRLEKCELDYMIVDYRIYDEKL
jgi:glycerophosphoryl diester phosphodiesterase